MKKEKILTVVGFMLLLIGAMAGDSESIIAPFLFFIPGVILVIRNREKTEFHLSSIEREETNV